MELKFHQSTSIYNSELDRMWSNTPFEQCTWEITHAFWTNHLPNSFVLHSNYLTISHKSNIEGQSHYAVHRLLTEVWGVLIWPFAVNLHRFARIVRTWIWEFVEEGIEDAEDQSKIVEMSWWVWREYKS
jgi:hypothetical protein